MAFRVGARRLGGTRRMDRTAARSERGSAREWGTTIRFHDPEIDAWRSTWLGPRNRVVMPFIGRAVGDEIVLEGSFEEGVLTRWIFHDIEPDSFSWKNVNSRDGGASWIVNQEMVARRVNRGTVSA